MNSFFQKERLSHFLKCWAPIIDESFGRVFPKVVLVMMHNVYQTENALEIIKHGTCKYNVYTKRC